MRVIAKSTLRQFWQSHPAYADAERPLTEWHNMMLKVDWPTPQALKADIRSASVLKGGRAVFNVAGNKYRVVVALDYARQLAFVKFVGTHAQYDAIDVERMNGH